MPQARSINILGATGSIGDSTARVIQKHADKFDVHCVTAHTNAEKLADVAIALKANTAVLAHPDNMQVLTDKLNGTGIHVACGYDALITAACTPVDITMAAIMGMAGLEPLVHAIQNSEKVAIANKEPLVAAGRIILDMADEFDTKILPVDSEHNAIAQVWQGEQSACIEKITITASGGPFLNKTLAEMREATPEQALAHPNWSMGAKISIDSATGMNKALEIIEASILFDLPPEKVEVIIQPQSIVHGFVHYNDGSVLAQMGPHDMCTPIANILNYPRRLETAGAKLDLAQLSKLDFQTPDYKRFPAFKLAYDALAMGQYACIAMNAANEVAVAAFLQQKIGFLEIVQTVETIIDQVQKKEFKTLDDVIAYDTLVRQNTLAFLGMV